MVELTYWDKALVAMVVVAVLIYQKIEKNRILDVDADVRDKYG